MAVAQRIELFFDEEDGCGFESHQSHALSEALGFSHLEPLSFNDFRRRAGRSFERDIGLFALSIL